MAFTKENFNAVTQLADDIFESQPSLSVSAVRSDGAVAAMAVPPPASLDSTLPAIPYPVQEVNAVRSGRGGRGRRGGRGGRGNRGGSNQSQGGQTSQTSSGGRHKGPKHPDLPAGEWLGCNMHFKHGRSAFFCSEPATCPWKNIYIQKPQK